MMMMISIHLAMIKALFLLAIISAIIVVEGRKALLDDTELERRLKLINKPPIKSIELDYAIFDCIDIYKQPAFDHPLLKNHKIQLEPSRLPSQAGKETLHRSVGFGVLSPGCPDGTVPVRRTTKKDLIREQSVENMQISNFYPKSPNANSNITSFATLSILYKDQKPFLGAETYINTQQPQIYPGEASGAQVWIFNASDDGTVINGISAGWLVDSQFYGDGRTYYTASWVKEEESGPVGCFNLRCSGFVQVSQTNPLGFLLKDVSKYDGPLWDMRTAIEWDRDTGNWWLIVGEQNFQVGYWPREILPQLGHGANSLHFGGVVKSIPNQLSPPMGSGISEECHFSHTTFFSNVVYYIHYYGETIPVDNDTIKYVDCDNYKLLHSCKPIDSFKYYFMYGGPRGTC